MEVWQSFPVGMLEEMEQVLKDETRQRERAERRARARKGR